MNWGVVGELGEALKAVDRAVKCMGYLEHGSPEGKFRDRLLRLAESIRRAHDAAERAAKKNRPAKGGGS